MKVQLVDDWKKFYKWWSVWIVSFMGVAHEAYEGFAPMREFIPAPVFRHVMAVLCLAALVSRLVSQKPTSAAPTVGQS